MVRIFDISVLFLYCYCLLLLSFILGYVIRLGVLGEEFVLSGCCCRFDTLCYAIYNDLLVPLVMCYNVGEFTRAMLLVVGCVIALLFIMCSYLVCCLYKIPLGLSICIMN